VTNAIKNSLQANPSGGCLVILFLTQNSWLINFFFNTIDKIGQPCDGPMGISVALTPSTNVVTISKSMITNASFRTKKLPGELTNNEFLSELQFHVFLLAYILLFFCINVHHNISYKNINLFVGYKKSFTNHFVIITQLNWEACHASYDIRSTARTQT
jgi:hypothetical protein